MLKKKSKATGILSQTKQSTGGGGGGGLEAAGWEVRPGGMLVQKRNSDQNSVVMPKIKVGVKFGSSYHEISISPQASFGELKKMLAGPTGMHPQDQKLIYKDKERNSKTYLDVAGVNNESKLVLFEDVMSRERRVLEWRKNEKMDKASKAITEIGLEVEKFAKQVATLESEIYSGKKAEEMVLSNFIELLMTQLLKLDEIVADGDVKLQRREMVRRVQKYLETLDMLKIKNASNVVKALLKQKQKHSTEQMPKPIQNQQEQRKHRNFRGQMPVEAVVTTKWETFDCAVAAPPPFGSSSAEDNFQFSFGNPFQFPFGKPPEYC